MKILSLAVFAAVAFSFACEACVHVNRGTGTYIIDNSGCVR